MNLSVGIQRERFEYKKRALKMKRISIKLGKEAFETNLADNTEILSIVLPKLLND